jgi:FlaA1/EpsC-like NDP-sugar epimerase
MFLGPAVFSVLFSRIYIETYELEAGPYILATVLIYWVLMILWFLAQYIWTKKATNVSTLFAVLAGISNVACIVLCIVTIEGSTVEKLLTGSLIVPVIFAIVATGTSNIYRRDILNDRKKHSKHHSEGPIVIGLDNGWN